MSCFAAQSFTRWYVDIRAMSVNNIECTEGLGMEARWALRLPARGGSGSVL